MINSVDMRKGGGRGGVIRLILSLLVCFLGVPGGYVNAQDTPTPAPTGTPAPLFTTPTPIGTVGDCPIGTPLPTALSIDYYNNCGECVPSSFNSLITPLPFYNYLLGTSTPESTEVPGATPTLTPTVNPIWSTVFSYNIVNSVTVLNPWAVDTIVSYTRTDRNNYIGMYWNTNPDGQVYAGDSYTINIASVVNAYSGSADAGYGTKYVKLVLGDGCQYGDVVYEFVSGSLAGQTFLGGQTLILYQSAQNTITNLFFQDVVNVTVNGACGNGVDVEYQYQYLNHWGGSRNFSVSSEWNLGEFITATPTPTPVSGYCSEYDYASDDTLLDFDGISIRQGDCLVLIPQFTINLPAVGEVIPAINWGIDGFSICPKWVDLGTFEIINIEIPLDILALPAVVFLLMLIFNM